MFKKQKARFKRSLAFTLLTLSATTLNAQESYESIFIDLDRNGLDDNVENYYSTGSNGSFTDFEFPSFDLEDTQTSLSANILNPTADGDNDGIRDILEVHGFYESSVNTLSSLKRLVPASDWKDWLKGINIESPAYQWLAEALDSKGYVTVFDDHLNEIDITSEGAFDEIKDVFIRELGHANVEETIYILMTDFLNNFGPSIPTDANVFYTDPKEISSDFDPYTDRDEALGMVPTKLNDGANHPLIGAIPQISTHIKNVELVNIVERREQNGTIDNTTNVTRQAISNSSSQGISTAIGLEVGVLDPSFTVKSELKHSNTWTSGTTISNEIREAFAVVSNNTDVTQDHCYSQLKMNVQLTNQGSVLASNIQPEWYVYIAGKQWDKITNARPISSLSPGETSSDTLLGDTDGCLTIAETNYLTNGGTIEIGTGMGHAEINYRNPDSGLIESGGLWSVYEDNFWNNLARIHLDITTTAEQKIEKSFWVRAYDEDGISPKMTMSVKEVLEQAYMPVNCADVGFEEAVLCLAVSELESDGYIVLSKNSQIDFTFYDPSNDFSQLGFEQSLEKFEKINYKNNNDSGDSKDLPLYSLLPRYSAVSIIDEPLHFPTIQYAEVIATSNGTNSQGIEVRASVSDYFGIETVEFCKGDLEDDAATCELMSAALSNQAEVTTSGYYSITLSDYAVVGDEFIRVKNINDKVKSDRLTTFYLNIIGSVYDKLDSYYHDLQPINNWINTYGSFLSGDLGADIREHELIDWQNASDKYIKLIDSLQAAKDTCSYVNPLAHDNVNSLFKQQTDCQAALTNYEATLVDNKIGLYNPNKLPIKNNLVVNNLGISNTSSSNPNTDAECDGLGNLDFVTGIDLNYTWNSAGPGARLKYRTIERTNLVDPLFTWSDENVETCGDISVTEQDWSSNNDNPNSGSITALVDFGWSVQYANVTELCVISRSFNLNEKNDAGVPQFNVGSSDDQCFDGATWDGLESFSNANKHKPNGTSGPVSQAINNLWLNAVRTEAEDAYAQRYSYEYEYFEKPEHQLVHLGEYRFRSHSNLFLTLGSSLSPSLQPASGNDDQIWIVEMINDREFRIRPKFVDIDMDGESDGHYFLTRPNQAGSTGDFIYIESVSDDDESSVNYNQHWRFDLRFDGRHDIKSVVNLKYMGSWGDVGEEPYLKTITLGWDIEAVDQAPADISDYARGVADNITHNFVSVNFGNSFSTRPAIFANMQTFNGADPAGLRIKNVSDSQFEVKVEEEQSADDEVEHTAEKIAFFATEQGYLRNASGKLIGEVGLLQVNQEQDANWRHMYFDNTYVNPVVIMIMNTTNGTDPSHVRIQSVANNSVSYKIEEWDYLTYKTHLEETVAYIVLEAGSHTLFDGRVLVAKMADIDDSGVDVPINMGFGHASTPLVFSQSQTLNGVQAIVTRTEKQVSDYEGWGSHIFRFSLQEEEANDQVHLLESVGIIAIGK